MGRKERLGTDHGTHPMVPHSLNTSSSFPSLEVKTVGEGPVFSIKHRSEPNARSNRRDGLET